jgi:hypothetical protein
MAIFLGSAATEFGSVSAVIKDRANAKTAKRLAIIDQT